MDLHSCFIKLMRARIHMDELQKSIAEWREPQFYEIVRHDNFGDHADPMVRVQWRFHVTRQPPFTWSAIVGDIVTNLRAALDHAMFSVVEASAGHLDEKAARRVKFPICTTPAEFEVAIRPFREHLTEDTIAWLETSQPYGDEGNLPLMLMNKLVNRDKHRAMLVTAIASMSFTFNANCPGLDVRTKPGEAIVDNKVLATAKFPRAEQPQHFDAQSRIAWTEHIEIEPDGGALPAALLIESMYQEVFDLCAMLIEPLATDDDIYAVRLDLDARDARLKNLEASIELPTTEPPPEHHATA